MWGDRYDLDHMWDHTSISQSIVASPYDIVLFNLTKVRAWSRSGRNCSRSAQVGLVLLEYFWQMKLKFPHHKLWKALYTLFLKSENFIVISTYFPRYLSSHLTFSSLLKSMDSSLFYIPSDPQFASKHQHNCMHRELSCIFLIISLICLKLQKEHF